MEAFIYVSGSTMVVESMTAGVGKSEGRFRVRATFKINAKTWTHVVNYLRAHGLKVHNVQSFRPGLIPADCVFECNC